MSNLSNQSKDGRELARLLRDIPSKMVRHQCERDTGDRHSYEVPDENYREEAKRLIRERRKNKSLAIWCARDIEDDEQLKQINREAQQREEIERKNNGAT